MTQRFSQFNMEEEFVGSHIDENGFLSFTKPKETKKRTKEDAIYGIWNEQVEESVFKGSKQLAKTTLGMNFRKSGQIQHEPDTGITIKQAISKAKQDNDREQKEFNMSQKKQTIKGSSRKVRFDEEGNKSENQKREKELKKKQQNKEDSEEGEDDVSEQEYDNQGEDEDDEEDNDDDDTLGFGKSNKNKMFFKSSSKKQKGILKKQKLQQDILEDLEDLDSDEEDEEQKFEEEKLKKTSWLGESMKLTKEQLRKKRIFDFKKGREDEDDEGIFEEQSKQFGLPINFGRQRKLQKREEERDNEEIINSKQSNTREKDEKSEQEKEHSDFYGKGYKMLAKMGYKVGQGIGKYEQGIAKPLEAVHKQNFSMQDNYQEMEKANKKLLKDEFGIDVEEELDQFDKKMKNGKGNQEKDDEDIGEIHIERTYVKAEEGKKKQFSNRYFSYLNGKSKRAQAGNNKIKPNEEGIEQNRERQAADGITKIVDMRGETSVTYEKSKGGYAAIFGVIKPADSKNLLKGESPIFGEMLLNLKNKLDKAKSKVMHLSSKLKTEEDRIVNFEYEQSQISQAALKNSKTTEQVVQLLKKLKEIQLNHEIVSSEQSVLKLFEDLFTSNESQFVKFNLEQLAVKTLEEILSRNYQPTNGNGKSQKDNNYGFFEAKIGNASQDVVTLQRLQNFLKTVFLWRQNESLRAYESELQSNIHLTRETVISEQNARIIQRYVQFVLNKSFIQPLNSYLMKQFTPTDLKANHRLIDCLECYQNILPSSSISDIIQTLILPRLSEAVKKWQPNIKKVSAQSDELSNIQIDPDMWLLPWMTIIKPIDVLKDTFKLILAKFSQALQKWEVEDTTMLSRIKPWQKIVSQQQWNDLMVKQIVPKLQYAFDEITVNPSEQLGLETIQNVIAWCELLQDSDICNIMEENLLAKLEEVLVEWINSDEADSQQIIAWLEGWRTLLGPRVVSIPLIAQQFSIFLEKAARL